MVYPENETNRDPNLWKQKDHRDVVVILRDNVRLRGTAHLVHNQRLLDLINQTDQPFLPLTNVVVRNEGTGQSIETAFVAVNKAEILLITSYSEKIEETLDGTRWSK